MSVIWQDGQKKMKPQIEIPYPREGSFTDEGMRLAKSLVKEGWGDPNWDYNYMNKSYGIWKEMKKVWDQGPEKKQVAAYVARQNCPAGDKPPPYCTPKITAPSAPKFKMTEMNTETAKSAKVNNEMEVFNERSNGAMVWLRSGNGIAVKPIKMADMEAICKSLPSPQNPSKFVTILQTHTRSGVLGSREICLFHMIHSPKRERVFINERGSPQRVKPIRPADGSHLQQSVLGSSASHVLHHHSYSEDVGPEN
ncbi:hypothetical protein ROHU_030341 [Labeo rohita]|uniref:Uncharacterized protein n=1 Tax=Labeo rohita TaxID=84645 RepID=A0A498LTQ5_LABRO|nr:hypothetical protein ROHU_030341 [Labeo rohita]